MFVIPFWIGKSKDIKATTLFFKKKKKEIKVMSCPAYKPYLVHGVTSLLKKPRTEACLDHRGHGPLCFFFFFLIKILNI